MAWNGRAAWAKNLSGLLIGIAVLCAALAPAAARTDSRVFQSSAVVAKSPLPPAVAQALAARNPRFAQFLPMINVISSPSSMCDVINRSGQGSGLILCVDAAATASYSGSGSNWSDLSASGKTLTLSGLTFNGVAGSLASSTYFSTAGSGTATLASGQSTYDFMHKAGAQFTVYFAYWLNSAPGPGQTLWGDASLEEQLAFVQHELTQGSDFGARRTGALLKGTLSAREAGAIVSKLYERPANAAGEAASRGSLAESFLSADLTPTGAGNNVQVSSKTDIHVAAGPDAQSTAERVLDGQGRVTGDLVRNTAGAFR